MNLDKGMMVNPILNHQRPALALRTWGLDFEHACWHEEITLFLGNLHGR
jgi:hypothetical protein